MAFGLPASGSSPFEGLSGAVSALGAASRMPMTFTNPNAASEFYTRLVEWINGFDASLDMGHEVGVRLVSFGQAVVFHLEDIGYWDPSLISFRGRTTDDEPVELIQHVSQISILLMKVPRKNPGEPKKPIGFHSDIKPETECDGQVGGEP